LLPVPDTIAANCCVVPPRSELEFGLIAIEMFLFGTFTPAEARPSRRRPIKNEDLANSQTRERPLEFSLSALALVGI
jgi:hypothetical protein